MLTMFENRAERICHGNYQNLFECICTKCNENSGFN